MFVKNRLIAMLVALFLIVPAWAMAETVTVDGIVYEIDQFLQPSSTKMQSMMLLELGKLLFINLS